MYLKRTEYDRVVEDQARAQAQADYATSALAIERAKNELLDRQLTQQHTFLTFLCSRVNALEKERAALFQKVTGIDLPTPTITPAAPARGDTVIPSIDDVLGPMGSVFEDMGEREAQRQGVGWGADGRITRKADEKR